MAEQMFSTLMRTTDVLITGLFSPAAIVAVGLADRYSTFPLRIGLGLGSGAIILSSQDTAGGAYATRDEAITQALVIGALLGIPFIVLGYFLGHFAIEVLGATANVIALGGTYLAIILSVAPARHVGLIAARAIQGTADTRTPMAVNIGANIINIIGTITLGLGIGAAPRLGVIGVGVATAVARTVHATTLVSIIQFSDRSELSLTWSNDITLARQLVSLALPRTATGFARSLATFPFNAILLLIGTEFNAAYQIGRRVYQQLSSPISRAIRVTTSIIVGQEVGEGNIDAALLKVKSIAIFTAIVSCAIAVALFLSAEVVVKIFTRDSITVGYGVDFIKTFAVVAIVFTMSRVYSGALEGGSDTSSPFIINMIASFPVLLGIAYIYGITYGAGPSAIYLALISQNAWLAVALGVLFFYGTWTDKAISMMEERRKGGEEDIEAD